MANSIRPKFFAEDYSIDRERITLPLVDDAFSSWLLSSPYTTTFSKMRLSKPHQQESLSPYSHSPTHSTMTEFEQRTAACRQTSKELQNIQHRCSSSSDFSNPGLTDDAFASSSPNSDASFDDIYTYYPSTTSTSTITNNTRSDELWDDWFKDSSPIKESILQSSSPLYHDFDLPSTLTLTSTPSNPTHYSPRCESPIDPYLCTPSYPGDLHRSDAVRTTTRVRGRTIQTIRAVPQYSAFPVAPPYTSTSTSTSTLQLQPQAQVPASLGQSAHQSWPQRNESQTQCKPSRSRAYTAPSQARTTTRPSNLNTCITASTTKRGQAHSAPATPGSDSDIVEQFVSHFDEDDDEEHRSAFSSFASRLYGRRGSSNVSGSWGRKGGSGSGGASGSGLDKRRKGGGGRKSLSELRDALRGCFGIMK